VATVDQAMALLSESLIGEENNKGNFPANSVNSRVIKRLKSFTKYIHPIKKQ